MKMCFGLPCQEPSAEQAQTLLQNAAVLAVTNQSPISLIKAK